ncbi:VOC family protein [bacterium]|nr:VOC family protein [bacterium]
MRLIATLIAALLLVAGAAWAQDAIGEAGETNFNDETATEEEYEMPAFGSISFIEIPAPDMEAAAAFYSNVFGWEITTEEEAGMTFFIDTEGQMGGFSQESPVAAEGGVIIYLAVESIEGALAKVAEAGGATILEKMMLPEDWGAIAIFADPNGNAVGLWSVQ